MSNIVKILSNYGSRLWSLISVFIFIPFYIKFLGVESYAIISFYTLLLGLISFIDSGMSSAVLKEFAKDKLENYKYSILRQTEKLYFKVASVILVFLFLGSDLIAEKWLQSDKIDSSNISYYIKLISLGIVLQLVSSMYYGGLFGLGYQVKANSYQIIWNVFKSGLIIMLFFLFNATLELFFIWQIICNLVYLIFLRFVVIGTLRKNVDKLTNILKSLPNSITKYIVSVTFLAILTSLNTYLDRLLVSKNFNLEIFGYYNIASIISQVPILLCSPLILFAFPLFSRFYEANDYFKLTEVFNKIILLLLLIISPIAFSVFFYAEEIILLWTGTTIGIERIAFIKDIVKYLIIGSYFGALLIPLNYIILASEKTKYIIIINLTQLLTGSILLYFLSLNFGLKGVGFSWIIINFFTFIVLAITINIKVIKLDLFKNGLFIILFTCFSISIIYSSKVIYLMYSYNFLFYLIPSCVLITSINFFIAIKVNNFKFKDFLSFPK